MPRFDFEWHFQFYRFSKALSIYVVTDRMYPWQKSNEFSCRVRWQIWRIVGAVNKYQLFIDVEPNVASHPFPSETSRFLVPESGTIVKLDYYLSFR